MQATRQPTPLDHPPPGWIPLWFTANVSRGRNWQWYALMTDGSRAGRETWVRIPGRHRSQEAAAAALQELTP